MTPTSPVLRVVSAIAPATALAIALGLFPAGPAAADSSEPSPAGTPGAESPAGDCGLLCLPVLGGGTEPTEAGRPRKEKEPEEPAVQPAAPAPEAPVQAQQPAVTPAATAPANDPAAIPGTGGIPDTGAIPDGPASETSAAAASAAPSGSPTDTSNWNTPVSRSARATQVAAFSAPADPGSGAPELLPVAAGTLLVAAAGGAFFWWGRNRLRTH
ncbi:hypothetical protein FDW83_05420 [Pseudarthrobacter sp. NamE2]|uniref:hypothetical protein n=1 Tax=Pseudarthrobacter sp. NamE2 TaxID=2576838 RepID=UPI0010FD0BB6|nr:hypothetical protein [Pseudarthrobacter sp. NamE2]TLM84847.1 hypothetical protein FDW83_05420 [Pseudarthrobacter sp. NamE2]